MNGSNHILLAEDDPNDVELTLTGLAEYNLANDVHVVGDGQEALDYLFRQGPHQSRATGMPVVVLLDIKLPKVDGIEVLRRIRSAPDLKLLPVVMLTSSKEERDLAESYRLGANGYVVKPLDFYAFVEAVKNLGIYWAVINQPPPGAAQRTDKEPG